MPPHDWLTEWNSVNDNSGSHALNDVGIHLTLPGKSVITSETCDGPKSTDVAT